MRSVISHDGTNDKGIAGDIVVLVQLKRRCGIYDGVVL